MKLSGIVTICLTGFMALVGHAQEKTQVVFSAASSGKIFFQPESDQVTGFQEVTPGDTLELLLSDAEYYYYVSSSNEFYTCFLTPGIHLHIKDVDGKVSFEGDGAAVNTFILKHPAHVRVPGEVAPYSAEWKKVQQEYFAAVLDTLQRSSLPEYFKRIHANYYKGAYLNELITGPELMKVFQKKTPDLPADYYQEVVEEHFAQPELLYYPKWFTMMKQSVELLEKQGVIVPDSRLYLKQYAEWIQDKKVRTAFVLRYLELILKKGYAEEFPDYVTAVLPLIHLDEEGKKKLEALGKEHEAMRMRFASISRGTLVPEFTAVDAEGKKYSFADYKGKVCVLEFWFSGCVPCKAEMPYMERLAEDLKGENIQFFSLSLDSGEGLLKSWRELVENKSGSALQLNVSGGFRSDLATHFQIRSVPRIVVVDEEGKVVDAFAPRPSDPKLRCLLLRLLGEESHR